MWNGDIRPAEMIPGIKVQTWYESIKDTLDAEVKAWLKTVYEAAKEKKLTVGGTVLVTVVNSLDYGEASSVLLESIQTELDPVQNAGEGYGLAPIGHVVSVKSAETVAVYVTNIARSGGYYNYLHGNTREEQIEYLQNKMAAYQLYPTGITVSEDDELLSLSTCEYSSTNGRLIVLARRIGA